MSEPSFSLIPVWQIVWQWRKLIIAFVAVVSAASAVAVFFLPKYYLSTAIAIPGNPVFTDKGNLFNNNIQSLYSPYGGGDELERLVGIGELDTVFKSIINDYDLITYYGLPKNDSAKSEYKGLKALREDLKIQQNEKGQLKVMMWNKDKNKAAAIVNNVMQTIQQLAMQMQVQYNQQSLNNLNAAIKALPPDLSTISPSHGGTGDQLIHYQKMAAELQLAIANNPPALIIQERGYASGKEDRPKKLPVIAAAFFLSLIFAILTALLYHRKNHHATAV